MRQSPLRESPMRKSPLRQSPLRQSPLRTSGIHSARTDKHSSKTVVIDSKVSVDVVQSISNEVRVNEEQAVFIEPIGQPDTENKVEVEIQPESNTIKGQVMGRKSPPTTTANVKPVSIAFRLSGWNDRLDVLNGEYLPLDDGHTLLNGRPIFTHAPVTGVRAQVDRYRMHWSHGSWRIGDKDQLKPEQEKCMAFVESDSTHPTEMLGSDHRWQGLENGRDCKHVTGVSIDTGTVRVLYQARKDGRCCCKSLFILILP